MWKKLFGRKEKNKELTAYNEIDQNRIPKHIAIIMDGNGRWAQKRGLVRTLGHRHGVEALRDIVSAASEIGVAVLTVYAFSTENWKRPAEEVGFLMNLFAEYLDNEIAELHKNEVRIRFIGDTSVLAPNLQQKMKEATGLTGSNKGLVLNVAVNYGGRAEIVQAVQAVAELVRAGDIGIMEINEAAIAKFLYTANLPDPDLIIRPSGDQRISNFLLWQSAYAEFWFTDINWPEFKPAHLVEAILDFQRRDRRFGGLNKAK